MLIISMYLEMLVITIAFIVLANYAYSNMSVVSMDVFTLTITLYFVVFFFSFILLVKYIFSSQENIKALEIERKKNEVGSLNVRANRKNTKIVFENIEYIESMGDYVKIVVSNKETIITKEKISKIEKLLPIHFMRVHRSFIINMNLITSFNKEEILLGNSVIPISRTYKKKVTDVLTSTS
ncbi:MAG: LytTR family transcriptional regulator [Cyclobacteriaceae bacterium]|nr:LytTR family transcriptional regulator [Cyclobacteriaceae bacterium]